MGSLTKLVSSEYSEAGEARLQKVLKAIRAEDASLFSRLKGSASNIARSIAGNMATPWVVAASMPFLSEAVMPNTAVQGTLRDKAAQSP